MSETTGVLSEYQYDRSVQALRELGVWTSVARLPTYPRMRDSFTPQQVAYLTNREVAGNLDRLVIVPNVGRIGLQGGRNPLNPGLLPRYDARQGGHYGSLVSKWWTQIPDRAPQHDNHHTEKWIGVVLLNDARDPRGQGYHTTVEEPGLVYTGLKADEQRSVFTAESIRTRWDSNVHIEVATIGQIVAVNAQLRLEDYVPLDSGDTHTRLVHYATHGEVALIPAISSNRYRQLILQGSEPNLSDEAIGIRRVMPLAIAA